MKKDLIIAINHLCAERRLPKDMVYEAVESALVSAYRRNYGLSHNVEAKVDRDTGDFHILAVKEVVESVSDPFTEISLEDARKIDPDAEIGGEVRVDVTPQGFGRIAAQTAKQVILQRLREAEREVAYNTYSDKEGELVSGIVQAMGRQGRDVTVALDEHTEGILPEREQIPGERYRRGAVVKCYVLSVEKNSRGPQIYLSRAHPGMLRRLLEQEVPEIFQGIVEIKGIAREPGSRSKVAVYTRQPGVDPVGACVGMRGVRIHSIVSELNGEKIDVIEWSPDTRRFIANALGPAAVINVLLDETGGEKTAIVIVPDKQYSLAIGRDGQNARLAAKLTGWRIDIKSQSEAVSEKIVEKFEERQRIAKLAKEEDIISVAKKILEGEVPLTKEEKEEIPEEAIARAEEALLEEMKEELPEVEEEPTVESAGESPEEAVEEPRGEEIETAVALDEWEIDLEVVPEVVEEDEEPEEEEKPKKKRKHKKKARSEFPGAGHRPKRKRSRGWDEEDDF